MNLYLIHCGFYDTELCDGVYESHVNFLVAAESFEGARLKAKEIPDFMKKRMHVDGVQHVEAVNGHRIQLLEDVQLAGKTRVTSQRHRDLSPKATPASTQNTHSFFRE